MTEKFEESINEDIEEIVEEENLENEDIEEENEEMELAQEEQFRKKEYKYRGKSLEELNKLDIREFAKFLPSRERRSLLRNSDQVQKFVTRCIKYNEKGKNIRTHFREIIIVPALIGLTIFVHNGRSFEQVKIIPEMLGHRLGEFSHTRKSIKHGAAGIGATKSSASRSVK